MRRYLIVANQTLGADELVSFVSKRAEAEPSEFFIVVPATPTMEMVHGAEGVPAVGGSTVLPSSPTRTRCLPSLCSSDSAWISVNSASSPSNR